MSCLASDNFLTPSSIRTVCLSSTPGRHIGVLEAQLHSLLTLALGGDGQLRAAAALSPGGKKTGIHSNESGWDSRLSGTRDRRQESEKMTQTCLTGQNLTATTDFKIGSNYVLFQKERWLHKRCGHLLNTML